jgi:hypothetical protein
MFKHEILILAMAAGLTWTPSAAQDTQTQKRFAGIWEATYKERVICTIKLQVGEPISGSTEACSINVDENGDLKEPEAEESSDGSSPILNPAIHGDILSFEVNDAGDGEPVKMELRLTGEGSADLQILDSPVTVKPIHFVRK